MKKVAYIALGSLMVAGCAGAGTEGLKDGAYSVRYDYESDSGKTYLDVQATLTGGVVSRVAVAADPQDAGGVKYAEEFNRAVADQLVGKTLSEAEKGGYVSGASKASFAFEYAVKELEKQAAQ